MLPTITRRSYSPFLSNLFDDDFFPVLTGRNSSMPAVNIRENEKNFTLELAVPGIDKKDLKIDINEDVLTISHESKSESEENQDGYKRKEFSYSSFCRSFYVPENVNLEKIGANYRDGVLTVELPKNEEEKSCRDQSGSHDRGEQSHQHGGRHRSRLRHRPSLPHRTGRRAFGSGPGRGRITHRNGSDGGSGNRNRMPRPDRGRFRRCCKHSRRQPGFRQSGKTAGSFRENGHAKESTCRRSESYHGLISRGPTLSRESTWRVSACWANRSASRGSTTRTGATN